jgi:phage-related protein
MSFYGRTFSFDGIPSENYSLTISSASSGDETSNLPGDVKLYSEKLFRRTDEFLFGVSIEPVLEFPVVFTTDNTELTAKDLELTAKWLFGRKNYAKLRIFQEDMQDVYFDCFLVSPKIFRVGNIIRGVHAVVHCKNAWGLTDIKTFSYSFSPPVVAQSITNNNLSDDSGYTHPTFVITMSVLGGDVTLTNTSDSNRVFAFTGLQANEILTINNSLQTIVSSTALKRLSNFNKNFFRLKSGKNIITVDGNLSSLSIAYPLAKKIGG